MEGFYYAYVLQCEKDGKFYTGFTFNLIKRFEKHYNGNIKSTKNRRPVKLIYFEACLSKEEATHREKYLKSFYEKRFLKNRFAKWFSQSEYTTIAQILFEGVKKRRQVLQKQILSIKCKFH